MGKPIDKNKPTKNLDELLGHLNKGGDDLDAFEQEALEGFATLESTQEAIEMKQRLDKRMEEKLAEKRKPLFIYWSAAAGVALIIGLIFMMNSNKDLKSESGLADNSVLSEKVLESTENNPAEPPADLQKSGKTDKDRMSAMGGKGNSQSGASSGDQVAFKQQGPAEKTAEEQMKEVNGSPVTLAEATSEDADKNVADSKRSDNSKMDDALANNKNNQNQSVPGYNASGAAAQNNKDANNEKTVTTKSPAKDSRDEEEADPKATEYFTARKLKKEKEKASAKSESKPASEIEGKFENSNIKTASLSIKDSDLKAKMDKFFSDKDYKKSFNCTLTINADDKVEGVVFQNPELFHKGEQKEIVDFLKKLKCFKNHEFAVYSTYFLKYQAQ